MKYLCVKDVVFRGNPTMLDEDGNSAEENDCIWNCVAKFKLNPEQVKDGIRILEENDIEIIDEICTIINKEKL